MRTSPPRDLVDEHGDGIGSCDTQLRQFDDGIVVLPPAQEA
ncbi:hypothetical protein ONA70_29500 [Micromonospora yasonensis]|nr:hypothetical protein [Micromonospora yasonensis]MCW3844232.1 hypothetical protein [Micromonospora yasonensis]